MIIDKLHAAVKAKGIVCLGLDTSFSYLPARLKALPLADAIFEFNKEIINATAEETAVYKLQIAYYEANGLAGLQAYAKTLAYLRAAGLLAIADVKRGDIAATAKEYAKAHFSGDFEADFMTLSPYMGFDSITPYFDYFRDKEKGAFVLMRTSNPGAKDIEYLEAGNQAVYYHVGDALQQLGAEFMGTCGYSGIGMVVGGTYHEEAESIRARYPQSFFLIPGYGAQGGKPEDIRAYLGADLCGGVVNSSRGIITAHQKTAAGGETPKDFAKAMLDAVLAMKRDIYGL